MVFLVLSLALEPNRIEYSLSLSERTHDYIVNRLLSQAALIQINLLCQYDGFDSSGAKLDMPTHLSAHLISVSVSMSLGAWRRAAR